MKALLLTLTLLISLSLFGQKINFSLKIVQQGQEVSEESNSYLDLLGKVCYKVSKHSKIDNYLLKNVWQLSDIKKETAVLILKDKTEYVIAYASINYDDHNKMYYVIDDIQKVLLVKNEGIAICKINKGRQIVGVYSTAKNGTSTFKRYLGFDNDLMKITDLEPREIITLDEVS